MNTINFKKLRLVFSIISFIACRESLAEEGSMTPNTFPALKYTDLKLGTGKTPRSGQKVTVHYTGTLEDGTQFDSSHERKQPLTFIFDKGQVIKGWDEGLKTMKAGGKRNLVIPPELAYGREGVGNVIPPNATLHFEVELLKVED